MTKPLGTPPLTSPAGDLSGSPAGGIILPLAHYGAPVVGQSLRLPGLPPANTELRFHPAKRWRFDFGWPAFGVAVEVNGGTWRHKRGLGGAHVGRGQLRDFEKFNAAQILGWIVLQYTPAQIDRHSAIPEIMEALGARGWLPH